MTAGDHALKAAEILDKVEGPRSPGPAAVVRAQAHAMTALALSQTVEFVRPPARVPATAGDL